MRNFIKSFGRNRRAAIAYLFAGTLLPLVMLIGLSIDYSFYVQAKSQYGLSADAAATYALREASAVYTLESNAGTGSPTTDAVNRGETAGEYWFNAQLATLPTATPPQGTYPAVTIGSTLSTNAANVASASFKSTVNYSGSYPPFFNRLFNRTSNWNINGTAGASTQYAYLELLIMMDTSGSMLVSADEGSTAEANGTSSGAAISATNPGTVATMDLNTVCIPDSEILSSTGINGYSNYNDPLKFVTWSNVTNLATTPTSGTTGNALNPTPTCNADMNNPGQLPYQTTTTVVTTGSGSGNGTTTNTVGSSTNSNSGPTITHSGSKTITTTISSVPTSVGAAYAPCAFACHTTNTTYPTTGTTFTYSNGALTTTTNGSYTGDLYGLARQLGVLLKEDVVFQSTETIINSLINTRQITDQFAVGVYSFDNDSCPIVNGSIESTDGLAEATTNLSAALSDVQADDYTYTPSETTYPAISPDANGGTNFPLSVSDLINGTMSSTNCANSTKVGTLASPSTATTVGSVVTNPEKYIFLITDGMEDQRACTTYKSGLTVTTGCTSSTAAGQDNACSRVLGEMTGIKAETNISTTQCDQAVCEPLKKLGYSIYVLDIAYPPVQVAYYYQTGAPSDQYISDDFSSISGVTSASNGTPEVWNEGTNSSSGTTKLTVTTPTPTPPATTNPPNQQALEACASSTSDFYTADTTAAIQKQMTAMLTSVLSSSVRITQ